MRALRVHEPIGPDGLRLDEVDVPQPPDDTAVRVAVHAAGVGFVDTLLVRGRYQIRPPTPFIPGLEVAGAVESAPPGSGFSHGDCVFGHVMGGGFAETAWVPADRLAPLPPGAERRGGGGVAGQPPHRDRRARPARPAAAARPRARARRRRRAGQRGGAGRGRVRQRGARGRGQPRASRAGGPGRRDHRVRPRELVRRGARRGRRGPDRRPGRRHGVRAERAVPAPGGAAGHGRVHLRARSPRPRPTGSCCATRTSSGRPGASCSTSTPGCSPRPRRGSRRWSRTVCDRSWAPPSTWPTGRPRCA